MAKSPVAFKAPVKPEPKPEPVVRNTKGLCNVLFQEIDLVKAGKSNPTRANAISKIAQTILDAKRLEMQVEVHNAKFLLPEGTDEETARIVELGDED